MTDQDLQSRLGIQGPALGTFCRRWQVCELSVFGSVLRQDFRPDSDIDVLVRFEPGARRTLTDLVRLSEELSSLLGRRVDLATRAAVESSRNDIRRTAILSSARVLYAA